METFLFSYVFTSDLTSLFIERFYEITMNCGESVAFVGTALVHS